jgi:hypothetical protein
VGGAVDRVEVHRRLHGRHLGTELGVEFDGLVRDGSTAEGTTASCSSAATVAESSPRSLANTASTTVGGTPPVPPAATTSATKNGLPDVTA